MMYCPRNRRRMGDQSLSCTHSAVLLRWMFHQAALYSISRNWLYTSKHPPIWTAWTFFITGGVQCALKLPKQNHKANLYYIQVTKWQRTHEVTYDWLEITWQMSYYTKWYKWRSCAYKWGQYIWNDTSKWNQYTALSWPWSVLLCMYALNIRITFMFNSHAGTCAAENLKRKTQSLYINNW